jgi:CRP-like cAMP-binding protein
MVEKESFESGYVIFSEGEPANYFYTLIKGSVKLKFGKAGLSVFTANHAGESFGWSSIVDRDVYSASAECIEPTSVIKIDRQTLWKILAEYPNDGLIFMKHLAAQLGQRLLRSYEMVRSSMQSGDHRSFGTGQVLEPAAEE